MKLSVVVLLVGLLCICNGDLSRLLLQTAGNCASVRCPAGTQCQIRPGTSAGEIECATIPNYCTVAGDCAVKNVGNCCGYYPGCVNINYTPDLDAVRRQCEIMGMVSVCGWSQPSGCTCQNNKCQEFYGTKLTMASASVTSHCDTLPAGYTLVGTPQMCRVMLYFCEPEYTYWANECGCGCKLDCSSLPVDYRSFGTPDTCKYIRFACNIGEEHWSNDCGCGCKQIINPCASMTCLRGTKCVDNGDGSGSCVAV
eukprot:458344_1